MSNKLALIKKDVIDVVGKRAKEAVLAGELDIPKDYSISNALRSAWLVMENLLDKNKRPALEVCTRNSIIHALQQMLVQGLDPGKSQVYFIVFGKEIIALRSYFGSMALAKRGNPRIADFAAQVVYEGDELEYDIINGRYSVTKHIQKFGNIDKSKIVAAYANSIGRAGEVVDSELMTLEEIKESWKMSKTKPVTESGDISAGSAHGKFTGEFAKRTVINRLCKRTINTSTDEALLLTKKGVMASTKKEIEQEVADNANKVEIIIPPDENTNELPETVEEEPKQLDTQNPAETDFTFEDIKGPEDGMKFDPNVDPSVDADELPAF